MQALKSHSSISYVLEYIIDDFWNTFKVKISD
jgi:hypothetical protein